MKTFFRKYWALAIITVAWFIFSVPFFLHGRIPFPSDFLVSFFPPWSAQYGMPVKNNAMPDVITQIYPWKMITIDTWQSGQVPLWNPYSFSGTPHAANYQSAVFSPFNILFFVLDRIRAWSILILLQPLLAGLGMYFFLSVLGLSRPSRLLGSISFMFCGFLVVWMAYGTLGYAALYLPYAFAGVAGFISTYRRRYGMLVTAAIGLSFLSGHFQISLYVLGATLAFIFYETLRTKLLGRGLTAVMFAVLGVGIAAPQLLVSFDAYLASVRSASFVKGEVIPWQYIITFFSPDFYGNPVTRNDWFGHYAEWAGFVGVIPLLFSLVAVTFRRAPRILFFAVLAGTGISLAYPTPLQDLLYVTKIPVVATSAASRVIILVSFSLSVLSAYGLDIIQANWKHKMSPALRALGLATAAAIGMVWAGLLTGGWLQADKVVIAQRNSVIPSVSLAAGLMLVYAGFRMKKHTRVITGLLLIVAMVEVLRFAIKWMPFEERKYMYPTSPPITYLADHARHWRVFGNFGGELSVFGVRSIEGYDALYQKRYGTFLMATQDGTIKNPERSVALLGKKSQYGARALDLLGVKYVLHRISDGRNVWAYPYWEYEQFSSVYKDDHYEILENRSALPRMFLASYSVIQPDDKETVRTLFSEDFSFKDTVILPESPSPAPQEGAAALTVQKDSPNELIITTVSDVPKLLYVADTFDPGWAAEIDGIRAPVLRANFDFRAVAVPAGAHTIRMMYWPPAVQNGFVLSALSMFIMGLWVLWGAVLGKRPRPSSYENRHI